MPKIDPYTISRIKEAAKIVDVVGEFVTLKKKGVDYKGLCPFHDDRHMGNFNVSPRHNTYKCFACDAKGGPIDFLMRGPARLSYLDAIRWLGRKYCIDVDEQPFNYTPPPPRPAPPPLPTLQLPLALVTNPRRTDLSRDALAAWIRTGIRWDTAQRARIEPMFQAYHLGHTDIRGSLPFTIFWQIDIDGHVRTGHLMRYKADGHRLKPDEPGGQYAVDWFHSLLSRKRNDSDPWPHPEYFNPDRQEARQCLFGEHLLRRYPRATVHIVESEKTALIMAIAYGTDQQDVWLACCGLRQLTADRLRPLIRDRRRIVLYPDRDGIDQWKAQMQRLVSETGYKDFRLQTDPVLKWWTEADGPKADIADVLIRHLAEHEPPQTIGDVIEQMPQARALIEKLDLEIVKE